MQSTITKWGNSQGVRLPKSILASANLTADDIVEVTAENDSIIITKSKKQTQKSIQERFKNFDGEYECEMMNWGSPVGKEIW